MPMKSDRISIPVQDAYLAAESVSKLAAVDAGGRPGFTMSLYTGAVMQGTDGPFVIDLAGLDIPRQDMCALRQHDPLRICGYSQRVTKTDKSVSADGVLSQATPDGREIDALLAEGTPLQASMFVPPILIERIPAGAMASVNGGTFQGPGQVWRKTTLRDISFVSAGRDGGTAAFRLAADDPRANTRLDVEAVHTPPRKEAGSMADEKKELQPFTAGELKAAYPEQVAALCAEAVQTAVAEERGRCAAILKAQVAPSEQQAKLALDAVEKGTAVQAAQLSMTGAELARLRSGGAPAIGPSAETPSTAADSDNEAGWKSAWAKGAELRAEFGNDEAAYLAYRKAKKEGHFTVK
jgi:hypothetical protein